MVSHFFPRERLERNHVMKRTKLLGTWGIALICSSVLASEGTVEIVGKGNVARAPEYSEIQVHVTSVCYNKPIEAQEENAVLSNKILSVLKNYVRTDRDKVLSSGGHTLRQIEYTSDVEGKTKVLCERKWRTTNTLLLKTEDMESVAQIQEKILELVPSDEGLDPSHTHQTYAELGEPMFAVFPETFAQMKQEAQAKAWDDASNQFRGFLKKCELQNVRLSQISQPEYFGLAKSAPLMGDERTPIIPDAISLYASWKFLWTFDPTPGCYR
ncbi:MAG: DUF541 domain-containing protein [Proteobacteria bacterium]|nr:DUF541 domain-containing protein [Pseudomonadota bacterium]NDG25731.1 DUF541 domain-containing protein [Pseudomonadota bacterium]